MKKPGLIFAPSVKRLTANAGAFYAYFEAWQEGRIPKAHFMSGSSGGAINAAAFAPWTAENTRRKLDLFRELRRDQIFAWRKSTEFLGFLNVTKSALSGFVHPPAHWSKTQKRLFEIAVSAASLSLEGGSYYDLLKHLSIFSSKPLKKFLTENLTEDVWSPQAVNLEIPAVDITVPEMYYFTNFLPRDYQRKDRQERLVMSLMASASIVAFLPVIEIDGTYKDDAAILDALPIERAMLAGCDVILALRQSPFHEPLGPGQKIKTLADELVRAIDLAIGRHTKLKFGWHNSINNDLEVSDSLRRELDSISEDLARADLLPGERDKFLERIAGVKDMANGFSFSGKKRTKIIDVVCPKKLPDISFNNFSPNDLRQGMEMGYAACRRAIRDNLSLFQS